MIVADKPAESWSDEDMTQFALLLTTAAKDLCYDSSNNSDRNVSFSVAPASSH
ncbi:hypothetical protein MC7420_3762 [Coleofasciculus chthonoplastes PCC 7420]|uniref:Uncharacterized protein n=1 Tax=Coleofasciculus chthonoplastes PCC 7420 TaxID=118168 RepID=B4VWU0_9CYAN|nr:hypothetical protein MC7420_3762 [Coleofasciculus chthonoplastes PCC 7420]